MMTTTTWDEPSADELAIHYAERRAWEYAAGYASPGLRLDGMRGADAAAMTAALEARGLHACVDEDGGHLYVLAAPCAECEVTS